MIHYLKTKNCHGSRDWTLHEANRSTCLSVSLVFFLSSFLSGVKMNSINWSAPNICVFIAQLVEHCSATQRQWVRIPLKPWKFFRAKIQLQLRLNCKCNCDDHISISKVKVLSIWRGFNHGHCLSHKFCAAGSPGSSKMWTACTVLQAKFSHSIFPNFWKKREYCKKYLFNK